VTFAGLALVVMLAVAAMRMHPRNIADDTGVVVVLAE
jgi:hypothetical protein